MPVVNLTLDLGRHEQVWGVGRATRGGILDGRSVHVVAATVMFGAIAAVSPLVFFFFRPSLLGSSHCGNRRLTIGESFHRI